MSCARTPPDVGVMGITTMAGADATVVIGVTMMAGVGFANDVADEDMLGRAGAVMLRCMLGDVFELGHLEERAGLHERVDE